MSAWIHPRNQPKKHFFSSPVVSEVNFRFIDTGTTVQRITFSGEPNWFSEQIGKSSGTARRPPLSPIQVSPAITPPPYCYPESI